jgi:hypothetical protein
MEALRRGPGIVRNPQSVGIYVSCFCGDGDLLSQWRAYGGEGGIALGFDRVELAGDDRESRMVRVVYEREDQLRVARSFVAEVAAFAGKLAVDVDVASYWLAALAPGMMSRVVCFKDEAFSEESEWRLVSMRAPGVDAPLFRATPRLIVPFREKQFAPAVVREIVVGPTPFPDVVERSFRTFLAKAGYGHVTVQLSRIPLRSL